MAAHENYKKTRIMEDYEKDTNSYINRHSIVVSLDHGNNCEALNMDSFSHFETRVMLGIPTIKCTICKEMKRLSRIIPLHDREQRIKEFMEKHEHREKRVQSET